MAGWPVVAQKSTKKSLKKRPEWAIFWVYIQETSDSQKLWESKILLYARLQSLIVKGAPGWPVGAQKTEKKTANKWQKWAFFWYTVVKLPNLGNFGKENNIVYKNKDF